METVFEPAADSGADPGANPRDGPGGQPVRSIGYVALQNKAVFRPGSADYEFIWKIIAYAYPDIYEAEYGK